MRNLARERLLLRMAALLAALSIAVGLWVFWLSGAPHQVVVGLIMLALIGLTRRWSKAAIQEAP